MYSKSDIRNIFKEKRKGLSTLELINLSRCISDKVFDLPVHSKEVFHIFLSILSKREVLTDEIIQRLRDKTIVVPKINLKDSSLSNYILESSTKIENNSYGIPEPTNAVSISEKDIDVVFVPLLSFDKYGNRVGYGKGFYDRFLIKCREDVIKIGLSFFPPVEKLSCDNHDVSLDYCVTPYEIYKF
ncbi:5-formyltetrahydrofolate cyclo-ligase [Ichthyobacterium seriolicida]|uniref:5-formyltetrahydrofolate cyclo-ligase n=1 Tax=Ichthyobacterium seriolicida TaxID=242600 RepID=A0A1J1DZJ1_9FLAO|nr:5-formyltetrahydrofolate cyclo-ligase [Ichthyobacterium seriolicida]BAV95335.1 5-formyltetrahydrofolate cyclo-ligase [Ichthyobacterium seriolicida]